MKWRSIIVCAKWNQFQSRETKLILSQWPRSLYFPNLNYSQKSPRKFLAIQTEFEVEIILFAINKRGHKSQFVLFYLVMTHLDFI